MPLKLTKFYIAYTNLQSSIFRQPLLSKCANLQLLPKGFGLNVNLAYKPTCTKVYDDIRKILNTASSEILKIVLDH